MTNRYLAMGIFIVLGVTLFAVGIFLVGSRHDAFSRHVELYTEFADLDGITQGSKVQVAGVDAGQVMKVDIPGSPEQQFRVKMKVDERFRGLIRTDSIVTVDTEGVVGNTFLTIHSGSAHSAVAPPGTVLQSKVPVSIADLLDHSQGIMNDVDASLKLTGDKLNAALDGANNAIDNANDLLVGLKNGRGPAGMLLQDQTVAAQIRESLSNVQESTANLRQASGGVNNLVADFEQRKLPQQLDATMQQVLSASTRANATIGHVQESLTQALGPDANGITGGQNISEALTNANVATANMAEDTEALKHTFFLRGFFKHRGYYTVTGLSPQEYRRSKIFVSSRNPRVWLHADSLFQIGTKDADKLSENGKRSIDAAVLSIGDAIFTNGVVIEGYSDAAAPADALSRSYAHARVVRNYLEARFPFEARNLGVVALSGTPPSGLGHDHWSGVCILATLPK